MSVCDPLKRWHSQPRILVATGKLDHDAREIDRTVALPHDIGLALENEVVFWAGTWHRRSSMPE